MKIAVTGGTGLLGIALGHRLRDGHEVTLVGRSSKAELRGCSSATADFSNERQALECLGRIAPDAVIHAAAQTDVDYCEDHWEEAFRDNVIATRNVAKYCATEEIRLVQVSTDYVFDGEKGDYRESDAPGSEDAIGKYAYSKLLSEREALSCGNAAVLRTNIYGWNHRGKKNYGMLFHENLAAGKPVDAFKDQYNTPMLANDFADVLAEMALRKERGVFHSGSHGKASRVEFATALARVFGFDETLVRPVSIADKKFKSPRPLDASLDSTKLETLLGRKMPTVRQGLERMKKLLEQGYLSEAKVTPA